MDVKNNLEYRSARYTHLNFTGDNKYNYKKEGLLIKCLPKILFKGNSVLVTFIQLIEMRIIILLDYIDKLKHFKHITYYK